MVSRRHLFDGCFIRFFFRLLVTNAQAATLLLTFRRYYTVYCPLNAVDLIERRYTRPGNEAGNY